MMCRIYWGKQPYVRYCYLTGQAGVKRPLTAAELEGQRPLTGSCHDRRSSRSRGSHQGRRVFLNVTVGSATEAELADMARYMDARYTVDRSNGTAQFYAERGISENMIQRCEGFGWSVISTARPAKDKAWAEMTQREQVRILGNNVPSPCEPRPLPEHGDALAWYERQMRSMYGDESESAS
jgi:hypothetical protein